MTLVVDASIAVKWLLIEEGSSMALALLGKDTLVAPDLVVPETGNVLWRHAVKGLISSQQAVSGMEGLLSFFDEIFASEPISRHAVEIAIAVNHPVYDCFYIALAEALDTTLVTADRRLAGKLDGSLRKRVELL